MDKLKELIGEARVKQVDREIMAMVESNRPSKNEVSAAPGAAIADEPSREGSWPRELLLRLRDRKAHTRNMQYQETYPTMVLCEEAADEIERQARELAELKALIGEATAEHRAERDRLAAELRMREHPCTPHVQEVARLRAERDDIEEQYHAFERSKGAECERLRAALEQMATEEHHISGLIARKALAGATDETTDGLCWAPMPRGEPVKCRKRPGHGGEHENGGWHWPAENGEGSR
jgi:hypothetical protein